MQKKGSGGNWLARNAGLSTRLVEVSFGLVWLADAVLKFMPAFINNFMAFFVEDLEGQPQWLQFWFDFWVGIVESNATAFAYIVAFTELALALALIFGIMRKVAFHGGLLFSVMIWTIPEGFGGMFGTASTDIGAGIIYAFVFMLLILLNSTHSYNAYTVDAWIEKKVKWWRRCAELAAK